MQLWMEPHRSCVNFVVLRLRQRSTGVIRRFPALRQSSRVVSIYTYVHRKACHSRSLALCQSSKGEINHCSSATLVLRYLPCHVSCIPSNTRTDSSYRGDRPALISCREEKSQCMETLQSDREAQDNTWLIERGRMNPIAKLN